MTTYTHTAEQHAQLLTVRLQLLDSPNPNDHKAASLLDWAVTAEHAHSDKNAEFAAITVDKDFPGLAQTVANALAAHPAQQTASETVARWSDRRFYNRRQQKWCEYYERTTGFEPLMCDYEAENESFVQAAEKSIQWYEDHTSDTYIAITRGWIPGSEYDTGESYVD